MLKMLKGQMELGVEEGVGVGRRRLLSKQFDSVVKLYKGKLDYGFLGISDYFKVLKEGKIILRKMSGTDWIALGNQFGICCINT